MKNPDESKAPEWLQTSILVGAVVILTLGLVFFLIWAVWKNG